MTNDPKGYRLENCADMTPFEGYDFENLPATIPLMASQLHTLEIHQGNPLVRDIFADSIALSTTIKDLKIRFDWQLGPVRNLQKIFQ